ncbi:MAG: CvpA family protein [Desulfovibrio sp.]|nr:CvpA family protein [Desulfovibrio sp.]
MGQDIFDLVIVLLLTLFTARGFINGFVGEVASLASLLGGFWVAHHYHAMLAPHLTFISEPGWRIILAYICLFFWVVIGVAIVARLLQKILSFTFVSWADKIVGGMLGFAKGVVLCSLVLLVLQRFFSDAPFMQQSRVMPYFNALMKQVHGWLPPDLTSRLGI